MTFTGDFVSAVETIIYMMLRLLRTIDIQIVSGIGLVSVIFSFIIMSIVISVFWKGGRG